MERHLMVTTLEIHSKLTITLPEHNTEKISTQKQKLKRKD